MRLQKTRTIPGLFNYSTPHPRPSGTWLPEFLVPDYPGAILPEYLGAIFAGYQSTRVPGYQSFWLLKYQSSWVPGDQQTCLKCWLQSVCLTPPVSIISCIQSDLQSS